MNERELGPRVDGRAWEEVDRWNAERDLAVKAAVDAAKPNPRDRARDHLANAGVVVQRQFRSDQERIAELEARLARVPALVEAVRKVKDRIGLTVCGGTPVSVWAGKDIIAKIDAALAGWEKP